MTQGDTYERLIALLDANGAQYRLIDHPPEGRTEIVSPMRGHPVAQAAKCIIAMIKIGKKVTKFVLAVVPGDARVNLDVIKSLKGGNLRCFRAARPGGRTGSFRRRHRSAVRHRSTPRANRRSCDQGP